MWFLETFGPGAPLAWLAIILLSASPLGEVRLSIPVAILVYDMGWAEAIVWGLIGNFGVVPLVWAGLPYLEKAIRAASIGDRFLNWLFGKARAKHSEKIEKLEDYALFTVVALPFPGTGAWTGTILGYIFGLKRRNALPYVYSGVTASCFIVTGLVVLGGWSFGVGV